MKFAVTSSRLGAIFIVLIIVVLDWLTPGRYRLTPPWFPDVVAFIMIVPMVVVSLVKANILLRRVERVALFTGTSLAFLINTVNLFDVVDQVILHASNISALPLVLTAIAIWIVNIFVFTLLYWLIDRGGPDARAGGGREYADFDFPATADSTKVPPGWQPGVIDYLFIGFTTTTAFSPTEAMPLTPRAKALVMLQSTISLITIVIVAARAIGIIQ